MSASATNADEFIAAASRFLDALEQRDLHTASEVIDSVMSPDGTLISAIGSELDGRTYRGPEEIKRWFAESLAVMSVDYSEREWRSTENAVLFLGRYTLTGRASDAEVVTHIGVIWELEDGVCRRARSYPTQHEALAAWEGLSNA